MLLAGGGVQPIGTRCYGMFPAVMVKDSNVIHHDSFYIIWQVEALNTEEEATDGMDICETEDVFGFE